VSFDSREKPVPAVKTDVTNISTPFGEEPRISGVRFQATGFVVPKAWDVRSQYGGFDGFVTAYAGGPRAHVEMRVGGRRLWGDYAWFDAAYIGGPNDRGYNNHRFAGDASLYGNASLHAWLGTIHNGVIPVRMGLVTFADVGRVWLAGEDSNTWHPSLGAGMLAQPVGVPLMVNFLVAYSKEATRFYFGFGYPF
jgi:hypothetical protein